MYALFLETQWYQYLLTSSTETGLLNALVMDIEDNEPGENLEMETFEVLQLHAGFNNEFDEELEEKILKMLQTLKTEKETQCKL